VYDTFHGIIPGQSSTPIERIDLEVSCGTGENKCREMLTFEVASFDIRYNCIMGRSFLFKFMPGPKDIIVLKLDQRDALAYENAALTHVGRFGKKEAQELAAKVAKTHGESTPIRTVTPKAPAGGTVWPPADKKSTFVSSTSNQHTANQPTDGKKKGATDKEVVVNHDDTDKKIHLNTELNAK
jgi:hypothetical protein